MLLLSSTYTLIICLRLHQVEDKTLPDRDVAKMIIQRLKNTSVSVPFAEVSRFAKEVGRRDLAALVRYMYLL